MESPLIRWRVVWFLVPLTPTFCLAWGYDGHRTVGDIASHYPDTQGRDVPRVVGMVDSR